MRDPIVPPSFPSRGNRFSRWVGRLGMRLMGGWQVTGQFPDLGKAVLPVAPHTSNMDFPVGVFVKLALGLRVSFLGKHSLFRFPIKRLMIWLGGIPVRRDAAHGVVEQMTAQFQSREQLMLVVAPEGTRSKVPEFKKGFLYIAQAAEVPLVPIAFDFARRCVDICEPVWVGDDAEAALRTVKQRLAHAVGRNPDQGFTVSD